MLKLSTFKRRKPTTSSTLKGEMGESSADLFKTIGAIHRCDVAARGIFSKRRSHMLDKLIFFPITRYLLLKFYYFCFCFGQFFYGSFIGFSNYLQLLMDENDSLSKDFIALNARKRPNSIFNRADK